MTKFTVQGRMVFPVDMLRYDACWPYTTEDAIEIACSLDRVDPPEVRTVTLITSMNRIAKGRWESFGWKVLNEKSRYSIRCTRRSRIL